MIPCFIVLYISYVFVVILILQEPDHTPSMDLSNIFAYVFVVIMEEPKQVNFMHG
jgi:hypothetical protein